jgi:hypothetical protein
MEIPDSVKKAIKFDDNIKYMEKSFENLKKLSDKIRLRLEENEKNWDIMMDNLSKEDTNIADVTGIEIDKLEKIIKRYKEYKDILDKFVEGKLSH